MKYLPLILFLFISNLALSQVSRDTITGYVIIMNGDSTDYWGTCTWHKARRILVRDKHIVQEEFVEIANRKINSYEYYQNEKEEQIAIPFFRTEWERIDFNSFLFFINKSHPLYK